MTEGPSGVVLPPVDQPGEVTWHAGYGPAPVEGICPHVACDHSLQRVVAHGPDHDHAKLLQCWVPADEGGCAELCRSWQGEWDAYWAHVNNHPRYVDNDWLHVPDGREQNKAVDW